jgi:hypothetical protein
MIDVINIQRCSMTAPNRGDGMPRVYEKDTDAVFIQRLLEDAHFAVPFLRLMGDPAGGVFLRLKGRPSIGGHPEPSTLRSCAQRVCGF